MNKQLVVKDNALINASYNLEVGEQRLVLLAIIEARESNVLIDANTRLRIHVNKYIQQFKVERHSAYMTLKKAAKSLLTRRFSFTMVDEKTGKDKRVTSHWIQNIAYIEDEAIIELAFTMDVVPLITRLEKNLTGYQLSEVSLLTSKYAIRLYEILISWRSVGKTPVIMVDDFRNRLGLLPTEYQTMSNFKRRVLNIAVEEINKHTDIFAEYESHKTGRIITGFSFKFSSNNVKDVTGETRDASKKQGLTEKQAEYLASLLASDNLFQSEYAGVSETLDVFKNRILSKLMSTDDISGFKEHANRVGFRLDVDGTSENKAPLLAATASAASHEDSESAQGGKRQVASTPKYSWDTPEISLLKLLFVKCPDLTKEYIEQLARADQISIHDVLNKMYIKYAKVESFELADF